MFEIEYISTYTDKVALNEYIANIRNPIKDSRSTFIMQLLPVGTLLYTLLEVKNGPTKVLIWLVIISFLLWFLSNIFNYEKRKSRMYSNYYKMKDAEKINLSINDKGIRMYSDRTDETMKWISIDEVRENKNYIYIIKKNAGGVAIPKNAIPSQISIPEMIEYINGKKAN